MSIAALLVSLLAGAIAGLATSFLGPRELEKWRARQREFHWAKPRKELLDQLLRHPDYRFRSLAVLSRVVGVTESECRDLLIQIGARGIANTSKKEQWALIERAPLNEIKNDD